MILYRLEMIINQLPEEIILEIINGIQDVKIKVRLKNTCSFFTRIIDKLDDDILDHVRKMSIHSIFKLAIKNESIAKLVIKRDPELLGRHDKESVFRVLEMVYPYRQYLTESITGYYLFGVCNKFDSCREMVKNSEYLQSLFSEHQMSLIRRDKDKYVKRQLFW